MRAAFRLIGITLIVVAAAGGLYPVRVGVWWIMTQIVDPVRATTWCEHALVLWARFAAQWFALLVDVAGRPLQPSAPPPAGHDRIAPRLRVGIVAQRRSLTWEPSPDLLVQADGFRPYRLVETIRRWLV